MANDNAPVLFVDFNQDNTSLLVGSDYGYNIFNTQNEKIEDVFHANERMCMIGRLFSSKLLTLVCDKNKRKLVLFHYLRNTPICNYVYTHPILAVKMNRLRLIVCVEDAIFIHNIRDMELVYKVEDTPVNPNGIVALSSNSDRCYIAYPGSCQKGIVQIFDTLLYRTVTSIPAHDGTLAALAFSQSGDFLATASDKGTVFRVFTVSSGAKIAEFRRSLGRSAVISSLSFSLDNLFLVVASNTDTVHVFKLSNLPKEDPASQYSGTEVPSSIQSRPSLATPTRTRTISETGDIMTEVLEEASQGGAQGATGTSTGYWLMDWMGSVISSSMVLLPTQVSEVFTPDRSFATAHIPQAEGVSGAASHQGNKKVAALVVWNRELRLLVAAMDGNLHVFSIDPLNPGEAKLIKTHKLLAPQSDFATLTPSAGYTDTKDDDTSSQHSDNLRLHDDSEFPPVSMTNPR